MATCAHCQAEVPDGIGPCGSCGAPGGEAVPDPHLGRTVAGKYRVVEFLDHGGMGRVYKATHLSLDRPVVLKLLNPALLADPTVVRRFHREARAASRLNHPNSVTVIDFGQTESGALFLAMEYLPGRSLARVIAEEYPLAPARIVKIGSQILAALTEAHALGILHCDLKPANVMLEARHDEADVVKVLDFGIARLAEPGGGTRLTQFGAVCGTPGYMSPEQARGEELDGRSDLYAVGAILYELVTGKLPFDAPTPVALLARMLAEPLPRPSVRRPGVAVPLALESLVMRALSPRREDRPASAEEFRNLLLECAPADGRHTPRRLETQPAERRHTPSRTALLSGAPTVATRTPPPAGDRANPDPAGGETPAAVRPPARPIGETARALLVILASVAGALLLGGMLLYLLT